MDFDTFKEKMKSSGYKIGLMSKSSFIEISKMLSNDETILFACETLPEKLNGLYGVVVVTGENFFGYIPKVDKTFQHINIARSEIKDIDSSGGLSYIAKIKTSDAEYCIGKVLDKWPKLSQLIKVGEIQQEKSPSLKEIFSDVKQSFADLSTTNELTERKLRCPKCNSENIEPMAITSGKTKGFGLGKAAVGGIALGPIGLAAGVIGMGKGKTKTDIEWICKSCGKQFEKPKKA